MNFSWKQLIKSIANSLFSISLLLVVALVTSFILAFLTTLHLCCTLIHTFGQFFFICNYSPEVSRIGLILILKIFGSSIQKFSDKLLKETETEYFICFVQIWTA
jgi:hypothetical protein